MITWKVQNTLKQSRKTIAHLLKFHKRAAEIRGSPREFVTLRVAQFVLKIAHLAISMARRGPRACGLQPRLWLLVTVIIVLEKNSYPNVSLSREVNTLGNLMLNKGWLSVTKFFDYDQFTFYVYWSIFSSKRVD